MMATLWQCTNREYHADRAKVGASMLKVALRSPGEYKRRFLDVPPLVDEPSAAMTLGSAVHAMVLEPDQFEKLFATRPPGIDGRTKDGKEQLASFRLSAIGKTELTADVRDQARAMAAAVMAEPFVKEMIDEVKRIGAIEQAITWGEDGIICKCKPDLFLPRRPEQTSDLILDLKTDDNPAPECWGSGSSFSPIRKYRYDLQGAHYCTGVSKLTGRMCAYGLIVVGKDDPFDVYVYDLSAKPDPGAPSWLEIGEQHRQLALEVIRRGPETSWRREEQGQVIPLIPIVWDN